jgi:hypothetical protein
MPKGVYTRKPSDPVKRFQAKFTRGAADQCWLWAAASSGPYGSFRTGGEAVPAHRFAFEAFVRPLREGEVVDHVCRNQRCVNPAHLEAISMSENTKRGRGPGVASARGRAKTHCKRGHPLFGPNLYRDAKGYRGCKTCQRVKAEEWRLANRARVTDRQRERRAAAREFLATGDMRCSQQPPT